MKNFETFVRFKDTHQGKPPKNQPLAQITQCINFQKKNTQTKNPKGGPQNKSVKEHIFQHNEEEKNNIGQCGQIYPMKHVFLDIPNPKFEETLTLMIRSRRKCMKERET